ncbi:MAG: sarcosine oxidase subunit alpha family protein [Pseudomonadota bacterium]
MAERLSDGGLLIDRTKPLDFTIDGAPMTGFAGDTLASALLANDQVLVGRSFKYHRPRGIVASGAEEPNALFGVGKGARFETNQRATTTELFDGLDAESQNNWPSLKHDVGALNAWVAERLPVFPAGFYYKTFIFPRVAWKHVFEPVIRKAAGLGKAPTEGDPDRYEHFHHHTDVLVVGAGLAGLKAAREAAASGKSVLVLEQTAHPGGRTLVDGETIGGLSGPDWVAAQIDALRAMPNVVVRTRTMGAGVYDHGYVLAYERVTDHLPTASDAPRHRLWRIRAGEIVIATGAIERPLTFANNDLPGVMLASAVRDYVGLYGVLPGRRAVIVTSTDDGYRTALSLHAAGAQVASVVDVRPAAAGALPDHVRNAGIAVQTGAVITRAEGDTRLRQVHVASLGEDGSVGPERPLRCDVLCMSGGWSPVVHLWSHCGGKLVWDEVRSCFRPDPENPPTGAAGEPMARCVGAANGEMTTAAILGGDSAQHDRTHGDAEAPGDPHWFSPSTGRYAHGSKHFVDFQNDVTAADVRLAAREGYQSVEHAKRYTTLGMATDQGKTSNINGLALLADALGVTIPEVGTTTFRPPYTPISMGSIAGSAKGPLFKAVRQTPMHGWHDANGADWEPVGDWRRPFCYRRNGETRNAAVSREVLNARKNAGMLDASTLGKIMVVGPDAGTFLDLIYTNTMSTLKVGRCRYGLMCNENGFLFDDGVVVRTGEQSFLCHTTSGGADHVFAWFEEWLQTEWWDLRVNVVNVTDQWAQIAIVGPKARSVLEDAGCDADLGPDALKFMDFVECRIGGHPVRLFRISFSGELSYEIATPAGRGLALWHALKASGDAHGILPYGTEALHIMRAEKGFIMIGDETDGTVTPQDLGMSWAVSKKKEDFIGKRAQNRSDLTRPGRKQLVGLRTEVPEMVLPDGAHAVKLARKQGRMKTIGHVTSTYFSPTLQRSIAMGLVEDGLSRRGDWLDFPVSATRTMRAQIVDPVFYDPAGEKQNG